MNYSKVIEKLAGITIAVGFLLIIGGIGKSDFVDEMHEYIPFSEFMPQVIIGLILMIPGSIVLNKMKEGDSNESNIRKNHHQRFNQK